MRNPTLLCLALLVSVAACSQDGEIEQVEPQNSSLRNSPIVEQQVAAQSTAAEKVCYWNDKKYSDGATVCDAKRRHKCWGDKWVDIGNC